MFVNFDNVLQSMRLKLPFGIAQVGRPFRNEITPGNFIFRTREFEQMEIEFFVNPNDRVDGTSGRRVLARSLDRGLHGVVPALRLDGRQPAPSEHDKDELAHYAKRTVDIEYKFPIGWSELMGIANRTDFDLKQHSKWSGKSLTYFDEERKEHVVPYVDRAGGGRGPRLLAFMPTPTARKRCAGEARGAAASSGAGAAEDRGAPAAEEARRDRAHRHELRGTLARHRRVRLRRHGGHRAALPTSGRGRARRTA
jgi:glycyl-tRNA synthetase